MNIKNKIKVGGLNYKVKQVSRINKGDVDGHTVGLWEPSENVIYIQKDLPKEVKELYLLHELIHAIFDHCNIEQDEHKVYLLSNALYMVIKDNPEFFQE